MRSPIVFLHGIHLNEYDGSLEGFYPGGFKWAAANGWGGEVYNFKPYRGRCYGHVEVLDHSIHIEKLGADSRSPFIDNVLVVWTAPDPSARRGRIVVGWFKNAKLYRERQQPSGALKKMRTFRAPGDRKPHPLSYQVEADARDCVLLRPEQRILWIPPRTKDAKGIPGQSPVYFPERQKTVGPELARRIRSFIANGKAVSLAEAVTGKRSGSTGKHQVDPERRKSIEVAAMKFVKEHFKRMNFSVEDVSEKNFGYDMTAERGDLFLCIEVKGRSGNAAVADFTFNEFDKIKLEERGKFLDGSYRICIVTDALNEGSGAFLHHFWYVKPTEMERSKGALPPWRNVNRQGVFLLEPREAAQGRAS